MKKIMVALILGLAVVTPIGVHHGASAATATPKPTATPIPQNCQNNQNGTKCCPKGYTKDQCKAMGMGTISLAVAGTSLKLTGTGTRQTFGSRLVIARVTAQHLFRGGHAFRVLASGPIPALRLAARGHLYRYNHATNRWSPVSAVTGSGIYQAVVR